MGNISVKKRAAAALLALCLCVSGSLPALAAEPSAELGWPQFLGVDGLKGVSDAKAPTTAAEIELKWEKQTGDSTTWTDSSSTPVILGDYVYCYSFQRLRKYELGSGKEVASAPVFGAAHNQYTMILGAGDGKIFVPCEINNLDADATGVQKNFLRAFDAETLEQLYVTQELPGSAVQSPVTCHDGRVFTGSYRTGGVYACFDTADENPASATEVKAANWTVASPSDAGFNTNGVAFAGDYALFTDANYAGSSTVWSVNYKTGAVADTFSLPSGYNARSTPFYCEKDGRVYLSSGHPTAGAAVRSYKLLADGKLDQASLREWTAGISGGDTQSSPVIYNDRLYLAGQSFGAQMPVFVVDTNTMTTLYQTDAVNSAGSAALTTAYASAENGNQVYLYFVANESSDNLFILKDKEGQTAPQVEVVPGIGRRQYCSQSIAIAPNGSLVWYNDAGYLYCYGNKGDTAITAADVQRQIERLPDASSYRYINLAEARRVETRYRALSAAEQAKVTNHGKLEEILALSTADPIARINQGIASLDLPSLTLQDADKVSALLSAYEALSAQEQSQIAGADTLQKAAAAIEALRQEAIVQKLDEDIAALPALSALTSGDRAAVDSLQSRYEALADAQREKLANRQRLADSRARVAAIEEQMAAAAQLISDKLGGAEITLESRPLIQELDRALEGLLPADLAKISEIEQYLSPAKVDLVNLMTAQLLMKDGQPIPVTAENAAQLLAIAREIQGYRDGILEGDLKYLQNGQLADEVAQQAAALLDEPGAEGGNGDASANTADASAPAALLAAALAALSLALACKRRRRV